MRLLFLMLGCLFALSINAQTSITTELWQQHCATCHGANGQGSISGPDLTNNTWQYGGSLNDIRKSITDGRNGVMPAMGMALSDEGKTQILVYVQNLSAPTQADTETLQAGQNLYEIFCASCHGIAGTGTQALGAPDLTDNVWLHGHEESAIRDVIMSGRSSIMPAHKTLLNDADIILLTNYVLKMNEIKN
jgi:cytochrome c oxidase cbb3-type subunit 3